MAQVTRAAALHPDRSIGREKDYVASYEDTGGKQEGGENIDTSPPALGGDVSFRQLPV